MELGNTVYHILMFNSIILQLSAGECKVCDEFQELVLPLAEKMRSCVIAEEQNYQVYFMYLPIPPDVPIRIIVTSLQCA